MNIKLEPGELDTLIAILLKRIELEANSEKEVKEDD